MSIKLVKWASKIKFSRGPSDATQYSAGGAEGEEVEVPQIDETLSVNDFNQALVNLIGSEDETKKIINKNVLGLPAIREGQTKFKGSWKKSSVMDLTEATKAAIQAVREYVPTLSKERGAVVAEAFSKAAKMDALTAAREKVAAGEMEWDDFQKMLEEAFAA